MLKRLIFILLLPNIALASFCGTNTIPPNVRLAQLDIPTSYQSIHQFKMTNTTSVVETYHLCRYLMVNTNEPQNQKTDGDCKDVIVQPHTTSPIIELKSTVHTAIYGVERMIKHAAVSSIAGACTTSDLKDSRTFVYSNPAIR